MRIRLSVISENIASSSILDYSELSKHPKGSVIEFYGNFVDLETAKVAHPLKISPQLPPHPSLATSCITFISSHNRESLAMKIR